MAALFFFSKQPTIRDERYWADFLSFGNASIAPLPLRYPLTPTPATTIGISNINPRNGNTRAPIS
jgi:hypothetical protein